MEKLFPISINPQLCVRCQKCSYSCPSKAIFFRNSLRFVDFNKCRGCLKCVDVCEHNAIEVISLDEGELIDFRIDAEKCILCKECLDFCFKNLFLVAQNPDSNGEYIVFKKKNIKECKNCLKCVISCSKRAIVPIISTITNKKDSLNDR